MLETLGGIWDLFSLEIFRPRDVETGLTLRCYHCDKRQRNSLCGECLKLSPELPLYKLPPDHCQVCYGALHVDPDWGGCECPPPPPPRELTRFDLEFD